MQPYSNQGQTAPLMQYAQAPNGAQEAIESAWAVQSSMQPYSTEGQTAPLMFVQLQNGAPVQVQNGPVQFQIDTPVQVQTVAPAQVQTGAAVQTQDGVPAQPQVDGSAQPQGDGSTQASSDGQAQASSDGPAQAQASAPVMHVQVPNSSPMLAQNGAPFMQYVQAPNFAPMLAQNGAPMQYVLVQAYTIPQPPLPKPKKGKPNNTSGKPGLYSVQTPLLTPPELPKAELGLLPPQPAPQRQQHFSLADLINATKDAF